MAGVAAIESASEHGRMSVSYDDVLRWVQRFAAEVEANKEYLTQLDAAIGDADHGINMQRGMSAVIAKVDAEAGEQDVGALLKTVGMTLVSTVGGAGGPLYGTLFLRMGTAVAGKSELSPDDWAVALDDGIAGVQALGGGATFADALRQSAAAAEQGMRDTIPLVARKGRASYLGERSAGHQDPGATSSHLLLEAAAETWAKAG
jgi:phosphoenolpyruvate---glycerone phosphotransferase subunit DhaL